MACRSACSALVLLALLTPLQAARRNTLVLRDDAAADAEGATRPNVHKWCALHDSALSCEEDTVMRIHSAFYNRQTTNGCVSPIQDRSVVCEPNATDKIIAACESKRYCLLQAKDHTTCPANPFTYLRVTFRCVPGVAREDDTDEEACTKGTWGQDCNEPCSDGCKAGCRRDSGVCDEGCTPGVWGEFCDMPCPKGASPEGCEQQTGVPHKCLDGKTPGLDPKDGAPACLTTCPHGCLGGTCEADGTCSAGCKSGLYGARCNKGCPCSCVGPCDAKTTGLEDGQCSMCKPGYTGKRCGDDCHSQCGACKQLGDNTQGPDGCTACSPDEPATLQGGKCECIEGATRLPVDGRCHCDAHADPMKKSLFVVEPEKQCRYLCKEGLVEVFGDKGSMCLAQAAYKAVLASRDNLKQGDCEDGFFAISVPGEQAPQCIRKDFVMSVVA